MATIKRLEKHKKVENPFCKDALIKRIVYNTPQWKKLRISYLMEHPLCELCGEQLAVDVHHKVEISTGKNEEEMKKLGFDSNNLMSLCKKCHQFLHKH